MKNKILTIAILLLLSFNVGAQTRSIIHLNKYLVMQGKEFVWVKCSSKLAISGEHKDIVLFGNNDYMKFDIIKWTSKFVDGQEVHNIVCIDNYGGVCGLTVDFSVNMVLLEYSDISYCWGFSN